MNSQERVLKAINREQFDRLPIFATITPHAAKKLSQNLDLPFEEIKNYNFPDPFAESRFVATPLVTLYCVPQ